MRGRANINNLRPEIRHELLYVKVRSISHLKELCQKRELLFHEDSFKRSGQNRNVGNYAQSKRIAVVESNLVVGKNVESEHRAIENRSEFEINAIANSNKIIKCWNCEEEAHFWDMSLKDRTIFCYECGLKNVQIIQKTQTNNNMNPK